MLSYVLGVELRGVCSLDVLAAQFIGASREEFVVATDARRREVYWAHYDAAGVRLGEPSVSRPGDVPRLPTIGPAAELYPDRAAGGAGPAIDGSRRARNPRCDAARRATSRSICVIPMRPS